MTRLTVHSARYVFGWTILLTHFGAIGVYVFMANTSISDTKQLLSVLVGALALVPLTAVYAVTFFRFVVANPSVARRDKTERMDWGPFAVQFFVILLFSITLIGGIAYLFRYEYLIVEFENINKFVSFMESIFAVFLGLTFSKLFPMEWEARQND